MKRIITKIGMIITALIIGLAPLVSFLPVYAVATLYETSAIVTDVVFAMNPGDQDRASMGFKPSVTHAVSSIKANFSPYTGGNTPDGTVYVAIRDASVQSALAVPTGANLAVGSIAASSCTHDTWVSIVMTPQVVVTAGTWYTIIFYRNAGSAGIMGIHGDNDNTYANAKMGSSSDGGTVWTISAGTQDVGFEEYGYADPEVTTTAATGITATTAILNGTLDALGAEDDVDVYFGWRKDGGALYEYYTPYQTCVVPSPIAHSITGLLPGQKYYYRIFCHDRPDTVNPDYQGAELDFTTTDALAVQTNPADFITTASAVLQGELTNDGTFDGIATGFVWDTVTHGDPGNVLPAASGYASNSLGFPASMDVAGDFSWPILCVEDDTYYFRAYASKGGNTVYGNELIFTATNTSYVSPLEVETDAADDLANTTATLNGELITIGTYPAIVGFDYGQFSGSWNQVVADTLLAPAVFDYAAVGLSPGTTYYVRAFALDAYGYKYGAILNFDTTGAHVSDTDMNVETNQAETNSATEMRLFGSLIDMGMNTTVSLDFDYGTTIAYGQNTSNVTRITEGGYSVLVTGLVEGTLYHYRAMGLGSSGEAAVGADKTFIAGFTSVLPATPTPTGTPLPTSTGIPIPPPPGGWGETGWHYFLLIIALVCAPLFLMFIVGGQIGKFLSIIADVAIFAAWLMVGWIEVYGIILTCLAAGSFIYWLIRPKAA